jgi:tRNA threonylcarbamoyladenosine biosynthesis protein TsaB
MAPPRADPSRPLLLAIDTSTEQAGLALYDGDVVAEATWPAGRAARRQVLPEILHVLALAGASLDEVGAVGVALGPGSFSALRAGVSLAKGLVYARRCALIGISTLDIVSYPHRREGVAVWAVVQAGRGRVVGGCYRSEGDERQVESPPYHGSVAGLVAHIVGPAVVAGEVPPDMTEALAQVIDVVVPSGALRRRRPGVLAELAWRRWRAGQADDPFTLEPHYLHGDGGGERAVRG